MPSSNYIYATFALISVTRDPNHRQGSSIRQLLIYWKQNQKRWTQTSKKNEAGLTGPHCSVKVSLQGGDFKIPTQEEKTKYNGSKKKLTHFLSYTILFTFNSSFNFSQSLIEPSDLSSQSCTDHSLIKSILEHSGFRTKFKDISCALSFKDNKLFLNCRSKLITLQSTASSTVSAFVYSSGLSRSPRV